MTELKKTENKGGKLTYTFSIEKTVFEDIVYTDEELTARKEKLKARIASTQTQLDKDTAELATINELISLK
jgi:hypothetical protein